MQRVVNRSVSAKRTLLPSAHRVNQRSLQAFYSSDVPGSSVPYK